MGKMSTKERILAKYGHKSRSELRERENQILADINLSKSLQKRTDKERVRNAEKEIRKLIK